MRLCRRRAWRCLLVLLATDRAGVVRAQADTVTLTPFPRTDVFSPLLADPRQPEFLASVGRVRSAIRSTTVGTAAFGENIGLVRWSSGKPGEGVQLGLAGGVFAQFDLARRSIDLLNADYVIGIPLSYRNGPWSFRFRLYHQSSHLGDEFLLDVRPQRVNLSFESFEGIASRDAGAWRLYGGGEIIVRHEPGDLEASILHGGIEYRGKAPIFRLGRWGDARWVAGLDARSWDQNAWSPGLSISTGIELVSQPSARRWSLLLEFYDGPSPYGQFYTEKIRFWGIGLHLDT